MRSGSIRLPQRRGAPIGLAYRDLIVALPRNFIRQFIVCLVISVIGYGVWAVFSGAGEVWAAITALGWSGWSFILGLSLFNYLLRFFRWDFYLQRLGYRVPGWRNLLIYIGGFGFTASPGKVGEAVRSVYLKRYDVSYVHSLSAFFVERLVDLLAMILVASLAAYAFESTRWLVGLTLLVTLALLPLAHSQWLYDFLDGRRRNLASEKLRSTGEQLLKLMKTSAELLKSGPLYAGLLLGVAAWFAEGFALYVVLDRMGAEVPLFVAAGIYGVSVLAGAVSFVPGGLSGTEIVMASLLLLAGVDPALAASAVIVCRLATLWFAVALGLACVIGMELGGMGSSADAGKQQENAG